MHLYVVTGSSRGLGAALVKQLTQPEHRVIGIARRSNPALTAEQWAMDLAEPLPAAERLQAWLRANSGWASATLINNAALLSRVFLAETTGLPQRRILNISSGLGRRAMAGSAAYCAVKAGLDHLSRALALEAPDAGVVSLAPGVIDTDMQTQLRGADPARFPEQARFQGLKDGGQLQTAEATAAAVLRYLVKPDFGHNVIADIREA